MHSIARYKLIDHFRRNKRRAEEPLDDMDQLFAVSDSNEVEARIDIDQLRGLSTVEAAQQNSISESAVKVGVHRALKSLGAEIQDEES